MVSDVPQVIIGLTGLEFGGEPLGNIARNSFILAKKIHLKLNLKFLLTFL